MIANYELIVRVIADGMMGPLKVKELVQHALGASEALRDRNVRIDSVRIGAIYIMEAEPRVSRHPGTDQSRPVEEVRDTTGERL